MPIRMQCGPVQTPYRLWNNLRTVLHQYGANTWPVESINLGAVWTMHDSLWAQNRRKPISESSTCSSFTHGLYGHVRVQKSSKTPQRNHPPSLIRVFAMRLIGKQGHKASSYEQRSLIKLSWAHMQFRFCRAQFQISQLLRIFITIVCLHALKQTELKLHVLRQ